MNAVVINVAVVLLMLAVDTCRGNTPAICTCEELPKFPSISIEETSANSPYEIDYSLTSDFDCSTVVFTNPARGTTNYNGTVLSVSGSNVRAYDYAVRSDTVTFDATFCEPGAKCVWYLAAYESNASGSFFCLYTCNKKEIRQFVCGSNNNGTSPNEVKAVNLAKSVSNGCLIHNAKLQNCPRRKGCQVF